MTNLEKCLILAQVMTNISVSALAGSENIIANVCSQVSDEVYHNKLQGFYKERTEANLLFKRQFQNWLLKIEDYKIDDYSFYSDIQYWVNSMLDIPVVSYHVLYPDKGLTDAQRSSTVDFIQKMIELVQETYTDRVKDCELLKDTDSHFASIENLLYMIMKYTIDMLTSLKGILADKKTAGTSYFDEDKYTC